jgi:hypothetical protein
MLSKTDIGELAIPDSVVCLAESMEAVWPTNIGRA